MFKFTGISNINLICAYLTTEPTDVSRDRDMVHIAAVYFIACKLGASSLQHDVVTKKKTITRIYRRNVNRVLQRLAFLAPFLSFVPRSLLSSSRFLPLHCCSFYQFASLPSHIPLILLLPQFFMFFLSLILLLLHLHIYFFIFLVHQRPDQDNFVLHRLKGIHIFLQIP
jgi:hypothetical protein